jgi:hypothetical protein
MGHRSVWQSNCPIYDGLRLRGHGKESCVIAAWLNGDCPVNTLSSDSRAFVNGRRKTPLCPARLPRQRSLGGIVGDQGRLPQIAPDQQPTRMAAALSQAAITARSGQALHRGTNELRHPPKKIRVGAGFYMPSQICAPFPTHIYRLRQYGIHTLRGHIGPPGFDPLSHFEEPRGPHRLTRSRSPSLPGKSACRAAANTSLRG